MKPDSNMETDRLLHRFARRRQDASMPIAERDGAFPDNTAQGYLGNTRHLDADELNAYAENALPDATRARYSGHLSDCDSCRKLVTELVLSSGVAVQLEAQAATRAQEHTRSWRDWLAVMFAPRVLRYAASVMLIVGVAAIALVVFRGGLDRKFGTSPSRTENGSLDERSTGSTSQNGDSESKQKKNDQTTARGGEVESKSDTEVGAPATTTKVAPQDAPVEAQNMDQEQASNMPAPAVATGSLSDNRDLSATRDKDSRADERRQSTSGEDIVTKSKVSKEVDKAESTGRVARETRSRAEADESTSTEGAKVAETTTSAAANEKPEAKKAARRNTEPEPAGPAQGIVSDDRKGQGTGAGKAEESRAVSGRQFVRRNGAWVDVAYRSQDTTNVRRGSDQYRALVADEPGLRAVANQLGGEVIVVWKGRAYRIH